MGYDIYIHYILIAFQLRNCKIVPKEFSYEQDRIYCYFNDDSCIFVFSSSRDLFRFCRNLIFGIDWTDLSKYYLKRILCVTYLVGSTCKDNQESKILFERIILRI